MSDEFKPTKTLRLTIDVPDLWADDLDESAEVCADGDEVDADLRLFVVLEEWFREDVWLTVVTHPGEKSMSHDFEVVATAGRIVGAEAVPRA